jgi:hypothetical protein
LLQAEAGVSGTLAAEAYELMRGSGGYAPDARLDVDAFRNVLALRAEIEGQWGGTPPPPDKYVDLSYYTTALSAAGR